MTRHVHSYLALGDSYTIGEAVPVFDNFPYQTVQLMRKNGFHFHAPEIVAKTGWTTFELADHLLHTRLNDHYDFVSLLIGVNNQYRGLPLDEYQSDLAFLIKKALHFADGRKERVAMLSIPDWGTTPFAAEKDHHQIAKEIDAFNAAKKQLAAEYGVYFIDITTGQRNEGDDADFVASDKLHPSGREYAKWALQLSERMQEVLR